jgi:hypothetical protein
VTDDELKKLHEVNQLQIKVHNKLMTNKTDSWELNSHDTKYDLPKFCPEIGCTGYLQSTYVYIGTYPYIHADITLVCSECKHKFNFCFPLNRKMTFGYTIYDSSLIRKPEPKIFCPFGHGLLEPVRMYGDEVFSDGTKKLQIRCPVCFFSQRVTWEVTK